MAEMRGMQMPEPTSGGGGSITNALMGIFRERTRAQKQLELMAYQSAMNVAGHVAKTKLGSEAISEAMQSHYERIHDPSQWKSEDARLMALGQLEKAGIRSFGPGRFEAQSIGKVEYPGGPKKSKGTKRQSTDVTDVKKRTAQTGPEDTTVNGQAQTVGEANVGDRKPAPTKGGYIKPKKRGSRKPAITPVAPVTAPTIGTAPSSYAEGATTPIINPASPVAGVNQPKAAKPRAKRAAKKSGMGQMPNTPPAGGTNA